MASETDSPIAAAARDAFNMTVDGLKPQPNLSITLPELSGVTLSGGSSSHVPNAASKDTSRSH